METRQAGWLDGWWTRGVALASALFIAAFVLSEREGLWRLIVWLGEALAGGPRAAGDVIAYYGVAPIGPLLASLLVGLIFGVVTTLRVVRPDRRDLARSVIAGGLAGAVGSQLIGYPLQHCTYAPDAPAVQAVIGALVTCAGALIALIPTWALLRRGGDSGGRAYRGTSGYFRGAALPYLFLLPTLLSLAVFLYAPSLQTLSQSLLLRRRPLPQERFVCLENYVRLAEDAIYRNSFATTLGITVAVVLIALALALGIAVLASQNVRGASIYRTLLIWPFALSPVVAGSIFLALFREGGSGLINAGLQATFGVSLNWLRDVNLAPWVIVAASVWNILGFNILFYIAGLQNVPKDLLEAAQIDGANRVQRFARITFPLLAPFTFFLLITNVTYAFYGIYGAVDTLTQGGPRLGAAGIDGGATNVLIYQLYDVLRTPGGSLGSGAAQALVLFAMVAGLTLLQFRFIDNRIAYAD